MEDIRQGPARFYDLNPNPPKDIPFYLERLSSPRARVLELGCGTGRVSIPLARSCAYLQGLDNSRAMLEICRSKAAAAGLGADRLRVDLADISDFELSDRFDLIIAPFRVIQNLESDAQLDGLFRCVRRHLAASGRCILNAFNPNRPPDVMRTEWVSDRENLAWEAGTADGRVTCHDLRARIDAERLILYPQLVYRRFVKDELVEEVHLEIPMRCHYPAAFIARIESAGYLITGKWGGYQGEEYGVGNELVVEFAL
jgi:SAM-dependent methyltransferase